MKRLLIGAAALSLFASQALAQSATQGTVLTSNTQGNAFGAVVLVPSGGPSLPSKNNAEVRGFVQVTPQGQFYGQTYTMANNVSAAGAQPAVMKVPKDSYLYTCTATAWNAATAQLQALGPDGVTYMNITGAVLSANGTVGVTVGANSTLRTLVTGTPTGLFCSLT